jgi:hypothetical protein|nr:MAG TPA: tail protein [Caudoviricetes sp.]
MPTTQNNTKNVSYGKFKAGAYFFIAPYGTALPTDNTTELNAAFLNMGFMGDGGFTFSNSSSTNTGYDANGDAIATSAGEIEKTMNCIFREIKEATMAVVYGQANATDATGTLTVYDKGPNSEVYSAVIEILLADGRKDRKVVPQCVPNQLGDETVNYSELVGKDVTFSVLLDGTLGAYYVDYIDSTETKAE